ncbi:unnamed protein product [Larinioides sclopetarius]|uniref:BAI1-associated protein 3 n=2 Tax=Larinioides sclopetarius TaxID=280406 RepID=A0AAV1Z0N8_9ARAC
MQSFLERLRRISFFNRNDDEDAVAVYPTMPLYEKFLQEEDNWVQVTNENFFENFTVLSWRRENQRLQVIRKEESEKDAPPPSEPELPPEDVYTIEKKQWQNLYVEVLYTIKHKLGANSSNYVAYTEELYEYARETFNMTHEEHEKFMAVAQDEKPPIPVLNVTVIEATGLEAKDPNGTSDPYCMLGIQPDPDSEKRKQDAEEENNSNSGGGLRGLKRFGASFKKRDRRDRSNSEIVPARLIRTTKVKPETLSPKWREKFRLDIDDIRTDRFHLDIWDHDDETSVFDAAKRLNEVSNLKGLGRYFKEVAQSARTSNGENVDDFLGNVNFPVEIVGSNGMDRWFTLSGRSNRSTVQGQVHLKLQLGTREDRGVPTGNDNEREVAEHEQLIWIFVNHELKMFQGKPYEWAGDLPQQALTILHQHAIQGDITELQQALCQWKAYFRKHQEVVLDYALMFQQLEEIEQAWAKNEEALSLNAEEDMRNSYNEFITHCFDLLRQHRKYFPSHNTLARHKLKFMLKCLKHLYNMEAFTSVFPFRNELRVEVSNAIKRGTFEWMNEIRGESEQYNSIDEFIRFLDALNMDLQKAVSHYHLMFESSVNTNFSAVVYKQMVKRAFQKVGSIYYFATHQNREQMNKFLSQLSPTEVFELFLVLQEFSNFKSCLPEDEQSNLVIANCYLWFQDIIGEWFSVAQTKIKGRIFFALEHDRELNTQPTGIVIDLFDEGAKNKNSKLPPPPPLSRMKYSSSAIDTVQALNQLKEFWYQLMWPDKYTSAPYILSIVEAIAAGVVLYSNLLWKRLRNDPSCFNAKAHFLMTRKAVLYMNNLEYALSGLKHLEADLDFEGIIQAVKRKDDTIVAEEWRTKLKNPVQEAQEHVRVMIQCFVRSVAHHMNYKIRKLMFHLAWGPEKLEPEKSIAPLLEYLERIFSQLRPAFLHTTFQRLVQAAWIKVLLEYSSTSIKNTKPVYQERPRFFRNLYISLSILSEFFLGDVAMLPLEELQCQIYKSVEREIRIHQSDTFPLIEYYFFSRAEEQFNSREAPLGYLTVRPHYDGKRNTVFVEVMNAKGLLPCDPNGLSDPFVILQLVPRHLFPNTPVHKTTIHMKTLNPIFMESFEWPVYPEQRRNRGAAINFIVMDYDYMRKNDFEGEAYYPLYKMIDIGESARTPEPVELILTCPNFKSDILIALGKRTWNREALRCVSAEKKKS